MRQCGVSIVDVSFETFCIARRVRGWQVEKEVETLSDHRYIRMDVSPLPVDSVLPQCPRDGTPSRRWAFRRLDRDALMASSTVMAWRVTDVMGA